MLKHIAIRDFAIVDSLEIDLERGMTVVTGETGAGKSIMLDALGLCIGDRADSRAVRPGSRRADISATFDLADLPEVQTWLSDRDLDSGDGDCILRRTIGSDGRSKAFINGAPSTLADCTDLGQQLVDIHSQHAHQSLLRKSVQRGLLDAYASATALATEVQDTAATFQQLQAEHDHLAGRSEADRARRDLLLYQVEELDALGLAEGEIETLERDMKALENADFLIESSLSASDGCGRQAEEINRLKSLVDDDRHDSGAIGSIRELLASAAIQLDEARSDLQRYADRLETDPQRLKEIRNRLESIYDLARKHRVMPEALADHHNRLQAELETLAGDDSRVEELAQAASEAKSHYLKAATRLSNERTAAAIGLAEKVMKTLAKLSMERCRFKVSLSPFADDQLNPRGLEDVEFLISTNPGASPGPLNKIASGGELSRISLALQVAAAEGVTTPTMIFDEVDVGIGGAVAEVVGGLLRELAANTQILCVTHLAQVAVKGEHHLQVSKSGDEHAVSTAMTALNEERRLTEIARMLGGKTITDNTLAHAKELLEG